jgi:hypothetical protein
MRQGECGGRHDNRVGLLVVINVDGERRRRGWERGFIYPYPPLPHSVSLSDSKRLGGFFFRVLNPPSLRRHTGGSPGGVSHYQSTGSRLLFGCVHSGSVIDSQNARFRVLYTPRKVCQTLSLKLLSYITRARLESIRVRAGRIGFDDDP